MRRGTVFILGLAVWMLLLPASILAGPAVVSSASIIALIDPTAKFEVIGPVSYAPGNTELLLTIDNPNDVDIPDVGFSINVPDTVMLAGFPSHPPTCAANVTLTGGPRSQVFPTGPVDGYTTQFGDTAVVTVSGMTLPEGGSCTFYFWGQGQNTGDYTVATSTIKTGYGSIPGVSVTFATIKPRPTVNSTATPDPSPTSATPSLEPSPLKTPEPAPPASSVPPAPGSAPPFVPILGALAAVLIAAVAFMRLRASRLTRPVATAAKPALIAEAPAPVPAKPAVIAAAPEPAPTPAAEPAPTPAAEPIVSKPAAPASRRSFPALAMAIGVVVVLVGGLALVASGFVAGNKAQASATAGTSATLLAASSPTVSPSPSPTLSAVPTPSPSPRTPLSTTWRALGTVPTGMWGTGAAELANGRVLVFDCLKGTCTSVVVDPLTGGVATTAELKKYQTTASVVAMPDGSVLAIGGFDANNNPLNTVQRWDPNSSQWQVRASMGTPRAWATVTALPAGRVLVAGGWSVKNGEGWSATNTAEIYNPATDSWVTTAPMASRRALASALTLPGGRVVVSGGADEWTSSSGGTEVRLLSGVEVFDPISGTWEGAFDLNSERATHASALLPDGRIMLIGGWLKDTASGTVNQGGTAQTEICNLASGFCENGPPMLAPHAQARMVTLLDGRFMVIGGVDAKGNVTAATEVFDPAGGIWESSGSLPKAVYLPIAIVLRDGRVLVVGGADDHGNHGSTILIWKGGR